jgi:hypothetical protein
MLWTHANPAVCLGQLGHSLFLWSTSRWGAWDTWQHWSSPLREVRPGPRGSSELTSAGRRGPKLRNTWQRRSSPLGEAEPGAMGHVATSKPTSAGRRGSELRNMWQRRSSTQQGGEARGHGPRGNTGAHLSKEVRSGATGHVALAEPTSAGRCGPKLQLAWQRVDARPAPCLNLELVCGGTRSSGCRQRPPSPPQERLRTHRWGQFFDARLSYLDLFTRGAVDGGPPGGAGARGPGAPTINAKKLCRRAPGRCRS